MTEVERNAAIRKLIKDTTKRVTRSRASARAYLIKMGFYTKNGNLTRRYGGRRGAVAATPKQEGEG